MGASLRPWLDSPAPAGPTPPNATSLLYPAIKPPTLAAMIRPRSLIVLFASFVLLTGHLARAEQTVSESELTFSLVLNLTSEETTAPSPDDPTLVIEKTNIDRARFTHRDLIAALREDGTIPATGRWQLVAVWADWPDADPVKGLGPRLYVRNAKSSEPAIRVPSTLASVEILERIRAQSPGFDAKGRVIAGREDYHALTRLTVRMGDLSASALGLETGRILYRKPTRTAKTASLRLARADVPQLEGVGSLVEADRAGVVTGTLSLKPARFTPLTIFVPEPAPGHNYSGDNSYSAGLHSLSPIGGWANPTSYAVIVCPVKIDLTLWRESSVEETIPGGNRRSVARTKNQTLTETDLLASTLATHAITDPTGWSLVACARKDSFKSFADFDLMARHEDGRLLALSKPSWGGTVELGNSTYSPYIHTWTQSAVRSTRTTTAEGASIENRTALAYGQYRQNLPRDNTKLALSGLYRTRDNASEADILANPAKVIVTHHSTAATLVGTYESASGDGIARLVLKIGEALSGDHVYQEPAGRGPSISDINTMIRVP